MQQKTPNTSSVTSKKVGAGLLTSTGSMSEPPATKPGNTTKNENALTSTNNPSFFSSTASKNSQVKGLQPRSESKVGNASVPLIQHREGPVKIDLPSFKPKNECNVIKIIQKEWDREVTRLNTKK